jgi:hypothetical protein
MSTDKKPTTFNERVGQVESDVRRSTDRVQVLEQVLETLVENLRSALSIQKEVIDNLVEELSVKLDTDSYKLKESLHSRLEALKQAKLEEIAKQEAYQVEGLVKSGLLTPAEEVDTDCVVVARPEKEGKVLGAGRVTLEVMSLPPVLVDQFVAKKVGSTVDLPDGGTVVITEIYKKVSSPEAQPQEG